jgi:hypothetical protein
MQKKFKIIINSNIIFLAFHFQCNKATARYSLRAVFPPSQPPRQELGVAATHQSHQPLHRRSAVMQALWAEHNPSPSQRLSNYALLTSPILSFYVHSPCARTTFLCVSSTPLPNPSPRVPTSLLSPQHPVSKSTATSLQHSHHYAAPCNYKPPNRWLNTVADL